MPSEWTPTKIRNLLKAHSTFWPLQLKTHSQDLDWLISEDHLTKAPSPFRLQSVWKPVPWGDMKSGEAFPILRDIKRKEMLRITVRDLTGLADLEETVSELSRLADFCLQKVLDTVLKDMTSRHGTPQAQFAIFGMGKLGGQELNYSSDIDIIFAYSEEGQVGRLTHHDFFTRVAASVMQEFRGGENGGSLFRVDLRLRPEGDSGPLTRSLESYENYYAAFGEVWERLALQKTRFVAGDAELGYEFIQHLQPFCFPKSLPPAALDEIFEIKARIENEILREGGLERHVKLGRGGIREIEFSIQALQLLHGSRHAFSQESGTLKSIRALQRMELLIPQDASRLIKAYVFLRRLEHRLQMREDLQTHTVPEDLASQTAIAKGLGFSSHSAFEKEWKAHVEFVRGFFHGIVRPGGAQATKIRTLPEWDHATPERNQFLSKAGFTDLEKVAKTMQALSHGPEYAHVSQRTHRLFEQLCPLIFNTTPALARPDFALEQLERFIEAYGSRAYLYELLTSNPRLLELLFKLFDHSHYLADVIVSRPALLETIAHEGLLGINRTAQGMKEALSREGENEEDVPRKLRQFKRAEMLRIEMRDILKLTASEEETYSEFSLLAEATLEEAITAATAEIKLKKGPVSPPFCIIAMGKFGGYELSYGSDLDVLFVGGQSPLAARILSIMSQELMDGFVFRMDARLRPDGEDGPLTLPLEAYQKYYQSRAQFWERQALTKARFAAGDSNLGESFLKLVDATLYSKPIEPSEIKEMMQMRSRIETERGDPSDPARDYKTGTGGLVDVEFLAQIQQLKLGHAHPELRRKSTLQILRQMPKLASWSKEHTQEITEAYQWIRKMECTLRRFHNSGISQLPANREEWTVTAKLLGLKDAPSMEKELMKRRKIIRKLFQEWVFGDY